MAKVVAIGGIFFKAKNPEALSAWYTKKLGIASPPQNNYDLQWQQTSGPGLLSPLPEDSDHFIKPAQLYISLIVDNITELCEQLTDAGVAVVLDTNIYPNGRFANLEDPEGNQVQLWQPAATSPLPPTSLA